MRASLFACVLGLMLWPVLALAQTVQDTPATLIADRVAIEGNGRLVAQGNVEVLYQGSKLKADTIIYDQDQNRLTIAGPITLTDGPDTLILADSADLDPELTDGILRSARLVLRQQLQLAAAALHRVDGRYSVLENTVASSCQVCADRPVPLWQIRARRIIHDEEEQQLYFDHARFEVMGVPVMYLPRLRLPDPTLKRATGFLVPELKFSDGLGTGLKVPYFITLGDHADLTLTPYLSTDRTRTLEYRYRQAFRHGEITFDGAFSSDDLVEGELRRYLFAQGTFDLPRDFTLSFQIETVSDDAYLSDYNYSGKDRLTSSLGVERTRRDEYIAADLYGIHSLRDSEDNETIPSTIGDATYQRRFEPGLLGGIASYQLDFQAHNRRSDTNVIGRDMSQLSLRTDWRRDWVGRSGLLFAVQGALALDHYVIGDDDTFDSPRTRVTPFAATELRWPLLRAGRGGAVHVLEPVVQLVWSPDSDEDVPNDDSLSQEFDEGNLFSLSRFPGQDVYERGLRANVGLGWTRHDPAGWTLGVTGGRILRQENLNQFQSGDGLEGINSDWLAAVHWQTANNLTLTNRAVFDDGFNFTSNELRMDWQTGKLDLTSSYVWREANPQENRPNDASEWVFNGGYQLRANWRTSANWRYDFARDRTARAGFGVEYQNECVAVNLSLSRRFTSSTNVRPTTDIGLSVALAGFGANPDQQIQRRRCIR
ncbi:LPS-assembly protein LptD [Actibacterium ureilyticum]|uniref:LPS-assembly protein LptD n=1 Tax=Actibacterium ureilyticum TaxID=1590614 RepID=UPI000BAB208A|nr:LPS assembly protein LptD [Actibacterium ureilyticum]